MHSLRRQIENIEKELSLGDTESPLAVIKRRQGNLLWYYSRQNVTAQEMVAFAKQNSSQDEQYKDNLRMFQKLIEEKTNGRTIEFPTFTGRYLKGGAA